MKRAIQFGAGNIGRGFIGYLLSKSLYDVLFVDVNKDIIDKINENKRYRVVITDNVKSEEIVENIRGMYSYDENLINEISNSNIITTAVGVSILPRISEIISKGIIKRIEDGNRSYLNIIACENSVNATDVLKNEILKYLSEDQKIQIENLVGFPNCSVDRIVPPCDIDSIDVNVEEFFEWNVEKDKILSDLDINGMNKVCNLHSYIERKLFTLNTAHSMTAYLGFNKGYETIFESINDPYIYKNVCDAMVESGEGLISKYSFDREEHMKYINKIINRFKNPYLVDSVLRVGREPMRKLSRNDRFIKPILTSSSYGKDINALCLGVAYALKFITDKDENSLNMKSIIDEKGIRDAIVYICKIDDEAIVDKIVKHYDNI